jgi:hypothetical protein
MSGGVDRVERVGAVDDRADEGVPEGRRGIGPAVPAREREFARESGRRVDPGPVDLGAHPDGTVRPSGRGPGMPLVSKDCWISEELFGERQPDRI